MHAARENIGERGGDCSGKPQPEGSTGAGDVLPRAVCGGQSAAAHDLSLSLSASTAPISVFTVAGRNFSEKEGRIE